MEKPTTQPPPHLGKYVKAEVLDMLNISVTEAALALGITRQALSSFLNGQSHLSSDMAIRLEKAFGVSMERLMRMQNARDIAQARHRAAEIEVVSSQYISNQNEVRTETPSEQSGKVKSKKS